MRESEEAIVAHETVASGSSDFCDTHVAFEIMCMVFFAKLCRCAMVGSCVWLVKGRL